MKTSYNRGFSIAAFFVAIAAFLGIGTHAVNNMQATSTGNASVQASNEDSSNSTLAWKVYSGHGFSVDYPSDWNVSENDGFVVFQPTAFKGSTTNSFTVSYQKTNANSPTGSAKNVIAAYSKMFSNPIQSTVTIDGQSATLLDLVDEKAPVHAMRIELDNNGYTYGILESGPVYYHSQTFEKFYQSFKFTDSAASSAPNATYNPGWKTYTDTNPGFTFSIDYPSDSKIDSSGSDKNYMSNNYSIFSVSFYPASGNPNGEGMTLIISHNDPVGFDQAVQNLLDISKEVPQAGIQTTLAPDIVVNNVNAKVIKLNQKGENGAHILLQDGNTRYEIVAGGQFVDSPEFQHFYQSLKFTN